MKRERWLGAGRLGAGVLLAALAIFAGANFRSSGGLLAASGAAAILGVMTWVRPGGRTWAAALLLMDLAWVSAAVMAARSTETGLTLLYFPVALAAGLSLGTWPTLGVSLAAGAGLVVTTRLLGGEGAGAISVVVQGLLVIVLGLVAERMSSQVRTRDRALVYASKALERLKLDTDSIVQNLGSGLISVNAEGRIVHLNRMAEETLGADVETCRGRRLRAALPAGCDALISALELALIEGHAEHRCEVKIVREDREIPIGLGLTVLYGREEDITGVAALFQDITEIRRQEDLEKRRERMVAVGELAAGIAHEIRNSVLPVSGSVQLLTQELQPSGEQGKLFEVIERETENIERFVSSLLSYTRERRLHPTPFDLQDLVREVAGDMELSHKRGPNVDLVGESVPVRADPDQLRQVLRNLLVNAADAAGEQGSVKVRTGREESGPWVEVEDDGPGVPEAQRGQVFQPFFTTKAGGTGLGLSIAARIVEDHGGELTLRRPGTRGAVFRVALPSATETEMGAAA